jgi:hypothetical protein
MTMGCSGVQVWEEFSFACWFEEDLEGSFLQLVDFGAVNGGFDLMARAGPVVHFEGATAQYLHAIVDDLANRELVGSEAGTGVLDFKEFERLAGAILDGCFNVVGVAGGESDCDEGRDKKCGEVGRSEACAAMRGG